MDDDEGEGREDRSHRGADANSKVRAVGAFRAAARVLELHGALGAVKGGAIGYSKSKKAFEEFVAAVPVELWPGFGDRPALQAQLDITLAREKLGWEPTVPLREGLVHTIAYFDQLLTTGPAGLHADN